MKEIEWNIDDAQITIHSPVFTKDVVSKPSKLERPGDGDIRFKEYIACRRNDKFVFNVNLVPLDVVKEVNEISVSEESIKELDNIALKALRKFLEICRWRTGAYWVDYDIKYHQLQFSSEYVDENGQLLAKTVCRELPKSSVGENSITTDTWNQISSDIISDCEVPLPRNLLLNAQRLLSSRNYRLAIVEAVTALEIVLDKIVKSYMDSKGIAQSIFDTWAYKTNFPDKFKVVKSLFSDRIQREIEQKKELRKKCINGIDLRNEVVHKGRIISEDEAELVGKYIKAIQEMIDYLECH